MTIDKIAGQIAIQIESLVNRGGYSLGKPEDQVITKLLLEFANAIKRDCGVVFTDVMD